ncbi:thiol-disulfide oxidoreductase DCC family protein [Halostagnicola bangensis]
MSAFINYFADDARSSPINLAAARVVLGAYVLWRVVFLDWGFYQEWPRDFNPGINFLYNDLLFSLLPYQQWLVAGLLALFIVGYKIKWTGGLASLLLMQMLSVKSTIYMSGTVESMFVCAYFILLFAFFHDDDALSADAVIRTKEKSIDQLNWFLKEGSNQSYRMRPFKWGLVILGLMYLGAAWGKLLNGGFDIYLSGTDLQRDIVYNQVATGMYRPIGDFVVQHEILAWLGFVGTAFVQSLFIVAIVLGVTVTPFILGLIGFHVGVILTLGIYFVDMIVVLSLYAAWDVGYRKIAADQTNAVQLVYDERCYFCARALYLFKHLDINDSVQFYTQSDAPSELVARDDVDLEKEMYLFRDGEAYGGYDAFRHLFKQFRIFFPITLLMVLPPVRMVGERIYEYIADNRDRHFVCSYNPDETS